MLSYSILFIKKIIFLPLREKCPYSEFFGPYFFAFRLYLSIFSPNEGQYGPEKLRKWTLFTQCINLYNETFSEDIQEQLLQRTCGEC